MGKRRDAVLERGFGLERERLPRVLEDEPAVLCRDPEDLAPSQAASAAWTCDDLLGRAGTATGTQNVLMGRTIRRVRGSLFSD